MKKNNKYILSIVYILVISLFLCYNPSVIDDIIDDDIPLGNLGFVNVADFGAKGDGISDDTSSFQKAVDYISQHSEVDTLVVPDGTYMIDAVKGINLCSDITVEFSDNALLKVIPNSSEHYAVINIMNKDNIRIYGGTLIGDKYSHLGTTGEWGMGYKISASRNVEIYNSVAKEFWGDGLYIGVTKVASIGVSCENITIQNFVADDNRRQGISIISGKNINIIGATLKNTSGTSPQAGIDIEPNSNIAHLENINIIDCTTEDNQGAGIQIYLGKWKNSVNECSITIENHTDIGSKRGFHVREYLENKEGTIKSINPTYISPVQQGFYAQETAATGPSIILENPTCVDIRSSQVAYFVSQPTSSNPQNIIGNVHLINPTMKTTGAVSNSRGIYFDDGNARMDNCSVVNPVDIYGIASPISIRGDNVRVQDDQRRLSNSIKKDTTVSNWRYYRYYDNTGATSNIMLKLDFCFPGTEVTFTVQESKTLILVPKENYLISSADYQTTKGILSSEPGASITLRLDKNQVYSVVSQTGEWQEYR